MIYKDYYEKMQELSFRATMTNNALENKSLTDFYSACETCFYNKLNSLSEEESYKQIPYRLEENYLVLKKFVDEKEKLTQETIQIN